MMQELLSRTRNALRKLWSLLVYIAREIWAGFTVLRAGNSSQPH